MDEPFADAIMRAVKRGATVPEYVELLRACRDRGLTSQAAREALEETRKLVLANQEKYA